MVADAVSAASLFSLIASSSLSQLMRATSVALLRRGRYSSIPPIFIQ